MSHKLKISVGKDSPIGGIVGYRKVTVRERLMRRLFGKKQTVTVIIPGDRVSSLSVVEEGAEDFE
ncbi:MAG: hypothetical protein GX962_15565 [Epulopiscium sp.]|nr:hypothetical protein [Candidatus Epulonipiscium sp.]